MNAPDFVNPLTAAHYDQVNAALSLLNQLRQMIGKCQGTGLDTRAHTELCDQYEKQLTAIKTNFFPQGRPRP